MGDESKDGEERGVEPRSRKGRKDSRRSWCLWPILEGEMEGEVEEGTGEAMKEKSSQGMMGGRLTSCKRETNLASNQGMTCHIINLGHEEELQIGAS